MPENSLNVMKKIQSIIKPPTSYYTIETTTTTTTSTTHTIPIYQTKLVHAKQSTKKKLNETRASKSFKREFPIHYALPSDLLY